MHIPHISTALEGTADTPLAASPERLAAERPDGG